MLKPRYLARQTGILERELDEEILILDTESNRIHQLNRTASFVWRQCQSPVSPEAVVAALVQAFDVEEDTALGDVADVLAQLRELGLIVERAPQD